MALVDPVAAYIAALGDHREDAPDAFPHVPGEHEGIVEFLEDQLHQAIQLALLLLWNIIQIGFHHADLASDTMACTCRMHRAVPSIAGLRRT